VANIAFRRGSVLNFDPDKEQFIGDAEANKLLVNRGRKGFEIPAPDKV
jgi:hypothetical protein